MSEAKPAVPWPYAPPEPWWWADCHPKIRGLYARGRLAEANRKGAALGKRVKAGEPVPWATIVEEVYRPMLVAYDATPEGIADRARREKVRAWLAAQQTTPCYVRFGPAPPGGRSRNWYNGHDEGGLCVFRARKTPGGEYWIDPGEMSPLVITLLGLMVVRRNDVYLAFGAEVGEKGPYEVVLADFALKRVSPQEIRSVWEFPRRWKATILLEYFRALMGLRGPQG